MSSDFFVWCFIVVNFEEIWTRPYCDVVMFWRIKYNKKWSISTFREKYINWYWLDQAWGRFCRDALYEMNCLVRDVKYLRSSLKIGLKLASNCWVDDFERNMLVCFFRFMTENGSGFTFITKFSKIFCVNIPGCVWRFESWCVEFVYIPGCVWNFCQVFPKWIVKDLLTALYTMCVFLQYSSEKINSLKLFLRGFRIVIVVFAEDDAVIS